jgi:hypothetical protein
MQAHRSMRTTTSVAGTWFLAAVVTLAVQGCGGSPEPTRERDGSPGPTPERERPPAPVKVNPEDPCGCGASSDNDVVWMELGCICHPALTGDLCTRAADDLLAEMCAEGKAVVRRRGCGRQTFSSEFSLGGTKAVYDVESGRVVGVARYNDVPFGQCSVYSYYFGRALTNHPAAPAGDRCEIIEECTICGPNNYFPRCPEAPAWPPR